MGQVMTNVNNVKRHSSSFEEHILASSHPNKFYFPASFHWENSGFILHVTHGLLPLTLPAQEANGAQ